MVQPLASDRPSIEDEQTRLARERVGQRLRGRWRLDELLGIGGMAAVYEATHRNGKRVAVKILHAEFSNNLEVNRRFVEEGYLANRVGHPGVVSILDDDVTEDGVAFLVMDLLNGETLDTRIAREGRLDALDVLELTDRLLDVLVAAHRASIIHRDIKPSNIFITTDGRLRLLDFGIARLDHPSRPRTTQVGLAVGTPAFMPPEQARGHEVDGRTDLWAVGATMFMALTGRQVHEAETPNEELLAAMTSKAPSVASLAPELPPALVEIVDTTLAYERDERWQDAATMQQAVREATSKLMAEPGGVARARESFVAFEDFTPPVPTRFSTARGVELPRRWNLPSLPPARSRKARAKAVALLAIVAAIVAAVWRQENRDHQAKQNAAAEVAAANASPPAAPSATAVEPNAVVAPEREATQAPAAIPDTTQRADAARTAPGRGKTPARRVQPAPQRPAPNKPSNETTAPPAAPAPHEPPLPPADPLDRRR